MEKQTRIAEVIDAASAEVRYDNKAKALLANKAILAWILTLVTGTRKNP